MVKNLHRLLYICDVTKKNRWWQGHFVCTCEKSGRPLKYSENKEKPEYKSKMKESIKIGPQRMKLYKITSGIIYKDVDF